MKICFLADARSIHTKRWCEHFYHLGYEIHLISFVKSEISGIKNYFIDAGNISVKGGNWKVILKARKVKAIIKKIQPDILHAHYATSYGLIGAVSNFHPYIVTTLGSDVLISPLNSNIYKIVLKYVFRKADHITLMADHMEKIITKLKLVELRKTSIVPFGIDTTLFNSKNRKVSNDYFTITSTRNFEDVYNIPHLLLAIAKIKEKIPNIKLNLIGDGSKRNEIEEKVRELGLKSITTLYGKVNQQKIVEILNQSHLFVSVSLSDGNNISLNEGMACGAYCIATNIPANQQWIHNNENGRLVEINDVSELATCIIESYNNYEDINSKAQLINQKIITEKADWNLNMQKMENKYKELCQKN